MATNASVHDIAAAIVDEVGPVDHLKLQKLVYYVVGDYGALTGSRLVPDELEAWDYGPVIYDLYIAHRDSDGGALISQTKGSACGLDPMVRACVRAVAHRHGDKTGLQLMHLTHGHSVWRQAYKLKHYRSVMPFDAVVREFRSRYRESDNSDDEPYAPFSNRQLEAIKLLKARLASA